MPHATNSRIRTNFVAFDIAKTSWKQVGALGNWYEHRISSAHPSVNEKVAGGSFFALSQSRLPKSKYHARGVPISNTRFGVANKDDDTRYFVKRLFRNR